MKKLKITVSIMAVAIFLLSFSCYFVDWVNLKYNPSAKRNYIAITDEEYQTVAGFGCSSCWTSQIYGQDQELTEQIVDLLYGSSEDSLGLSIYRYNIGGGGYYLTDDFPYNQGWYQKERGAECFLKVQEFTGSTASSILSYVSNVNNYDFENIDVAAMNALNEALSLGNVTKLVLFVNSPPYIMTKNGLCTGTKEKENNLREDCYAAFAKYLLIVTDYFVDKIETLGLSDKVEIQISPINEPQWDWGGESASQEGCHYDADKAALALNYVWKEMKAYKKTNSVENLTMEAFESGNNKSQSGIYKYINEMKKYEYYNELDSIAVHSYGSPLNDRYKTTLAKKSDKVISMTEYCQMEAGMDYGIKGGVDIATVMAKDFYNMDAVSWCWWLGVSTYDYNWNDGLLYVDWNETTNTYKEGSLVVPKRFYAMSNFTKFVHEGDVRIGTYSCFMNLFSSVDQVAFKCSDGSYTLILVNSGDKDLNINLESGFDTMRIYTTDKTHNCQITYNDKALDSITLGAQSVVTIKLTK